MTISKRDQATELRALIDQAVSTQRERVEVPRSPNALTIAVTSGKGGVGKSVIALNLAISLALQNCRVGLLDADLGLGNLDLMCGLKAEWNLLDVLLHGRPLRDILLQGPDGVRILPGASGLIELADSSTAGRQQILAEFAQLDDLFDVLIIDCGTGIHSATRHFAAAADTVLLVSTLEVTSLADTYAAVKVYRSSGLEDVRVLFNQCHPRQAAQAISNLQQTSRKYLNYELSIAGCVPVDPSVSTSVARRTPLLAAFPESEAGQSIQNLARMFSPHHPATFLKVHSPFVTRLFSPSTAAA
ncbi:MAG: P-loop NTPase [Planctomycetaceae bacterium]|nr:P-loop NTPase [Planctomycetaceae bacterium]